MASIAHSDDQEEHIHISTALEVEKLETNLFRSRILWKPFRSRGVFGGQVISQACVSATNCVEPGFNLHSLHCYFLKSASPEVPIVYQVERLRTGRSYVTSSVKAVQNGQVVFMMLCSFQKPEPWQPSYQWPMPKVLPPDQCVLIEDRYLQLAHKEGANEKQQKIFTDLANERRKSAIAVKTTELISLGQEKDGSEIIYYYWMKARSMPQPCEASFQKCILGYLSDLFFIGSGSRTLGLRPYTKGPQGVTMSTTLDHSICFYDDNFDCGNWLLYVMSSPRSQSGRSYVRGQLYNEGGKLVAVTTQEGVVRAGVRGPEAKL
jgi:acyl-CoA thioesterase II